VKVKLNCEWLGNPPGMILELRDETAMILLDRKVATKYVEPQEENKLAEVLQIDSGTKKTKDIRSAPRDKMVKDDGGVKTKDPTFTQ
jgi:hypothetical protein